MLASNLLVFDSFEHQVVKRARDFLRHRRHEGLRVDFELAEPPGAFEDFSQCVAGQLGLLLQEGEDNAGVQVKFEAAASLRKWPSVRGQRLTEAKYPSPYTLLEGTLGECLREFMRKPPTQRHLYEIHTSPQDPLVSEIISAGQAAELARLHSFLEAMG